MKKKLEVSKLVNELHGASAFFKQPAVASPPTTEALPQPQSPKKQTESGKQPTQKATYPLTQISKGLSNHLSKSIATDDVELFDFELRKIRKFRVNADIPEDW